GEPVLARGRALRDRVRDRTGPGAVPGHARSERARPGVERRPRGEPVLLELPAGGRPGGPEVLEVRANGLGPPVEQPVGEGEAMERLGPEGALAVRGEAAGADGGR